jgi:hypothetical protein
LANNIEYKIKETIRARILLAIKNKYTKKAYKSMDLLGCDIGVLLNHIEKQFLPGMNWGNHGLRGWHIDHIIPCDAYNLRKESEQKKCFHYTNLQPLWEKDNTTKKNKIDYDLIEKHNIQNLLPEGRAKRKMIYCQKCKIAITVHSDTLKEDKIKLCSKCQEEKKK